jgi:integrator complex subunit 7
VARALTLRILGLCARITADNKQIHHCIKVGLLSRDAVEVRAAIFAVDQFAAVSKSFATSVWIKLYEMMTTPSVSVEMQLCLIPALRHMHHDTEITKKIEFVCNNLLKSQPSLHMTSAILLTLTSLAASAMVNIDSHCALLLEYVKTDDRFQIQAIALRCLYRLAQAAPHVWNVEHTKTLFQFLADEKRLALQILALKILTVLLSKRSAGSDEAVLNIAVACCCRYSCSSHIVLSKWAVKLFVCLAADRNVANKQIVKQASAAVESLLRTSEEAGDTAAFSVAVSSAVRLCHIHQDLACNYATTLVEYLKLSEEVNISSKVCEGLTMLCGKGLVDLKRHVNTLCEKLHWCQLCKTNTETLTTTLVTIILQTYCGEQLPTPVHSVLSFEVVQSTPSWFLYRIGRQAARYGHHSLAASLFSSLKTKVVSESFYYWLCALQHCCQAESSFSGNTRCSVTEIYRILSTAYRHHLSTKSSLDAILTATHSLHFQAKFIQCRLKMLMALRQLMNVCNNFYMCPSPALMSQSLPLHLLPQLNDCLSELRSLDAAQASLYESCFDADEQSVHYLQVREKVCQFLLATVGNLISLCKGNKGTFADILEAAPNTRELQLWHNIFLKIHSLTKVINADSSINGLSVAHITYVRQVISLLCSAPLCLPRFFFQRQFNTNVKLSVLPQPSGNADAVLVNKDIRLVLKVEGVIQYSSSHFRKIKQMRVVVTSEMKQRTVAAGTVEGDSKLLELQPVTSHERRVTPHNDYFVSEFLMQFVETGLYQVSVAAFIVDRSGYSWAVGQPVRVNVKSHQDRIVHQAIASHMQGTSS